MAQIRYRPEIDGLRAVSVIAVVLFHMGIVQCPGGYLGVDVFFVISGYLITSILTGELKNGTFSLTRFYCRRARRIFPALAVATAATLAASYVLLFRGDLDVIAAQAAAALLSFANIYFWRSPGDYWGRQAEESPLLQTWSLGVEEHFYLVYPIGLWLIFRLRRRLLHHILIASILASLSLFLWGTVAHPAATFYLLPTRAWELTTGCFVAIRETPDSGERRRHKILASVGLCLVLASFRFLSEFGATAVVPVVGAALILAFAQTGMCHSVLSSRPLVHIGQLSYSIYLWHWPVIFFAGTLGVASMRITLTGVIYLLSLLTYRLVESPGRSQLGAMPWIAVAYTLVLGTAGTLITLPATYRTAAFAQPVYYGAYYNLNPHRKLDRDLRRIMATVAEPLRDPHVHASLDDGMIVGTGTTNPQIVVLGDSHGLMWSHVIHKISSKLGIKAAFYSVDGVSPFVELPLSPSQPPGRLAPAEKYAYDQGRLASIIEWKPKIVIVCTRWCSVRETQAADLLEFLEEHASHVLLMEQPPELTVGNRNVLEYLCFLGVKPEDGVKKYLPIRTTDDQKDGRAVVRMLAQKYKRCDYIPTYDLFVDESQVLVLDGKQVVYLDDDHLVSHGAELASDRIERMISSFLVYGVSSGETSGK